MARSPSTAGRRWTSRLGRFTLQVTALALLVWAGLRLSGRFLTIERSGGDQSQTSPVDLTPRAPAAPLPAIEASEVRNVILLIGDGMGFSHVLIARSELGGLNQKLFLERFPFTGWQTTHSLESVYTDSAASASSLTTGHKVLYGSLAVSADGTPLATLGEAARDRGLAVGIVTDSYLWDATPASFFCHVASRREFDTIVRQMAASGATLLAGERHDTEPHPERIQAFADAGFDVVQSAAELAERSPGASAPLLGLFEPGVVADPGSAPTLVELARFALDKVSRDPDGYLLVVESEEPDSGAHRRELQRIVRGIHSLDEVARLAVDRALAERDTLVLITADHETGGLDVLHGDADHTLGVRWSTSSHSAEPVPIYAFGAGAERFSGVMDNTEIPRILSELLGLDLFR